MATPNAGLCFFIYRAESPCVCVACNMDLCLFFENIRVWESSLESQELVIKSFSYPSKAGFFFGLCSYPPKQYKPPERLSWKKENNCSVVKPEIEGGETWKRELRAATANTATANMPSLTDDVSWPAATQVSLSLMHSPFLYHSNLFIFSSFNFVYQPSFVSLIILKVIIWAVHSFCIVIVRPLRGILASLNLGPLCFAYSKFWYGYDVIIWGNSDCQNDLTKSACFRQLARGCYSDCRDNIMDTIPTETDQLPQRITMQQSEPCRSCIMAAS